MVPERGIANSACMPCEARSKHYYCSKVGSSKDAIPSSECAGASQSCWLLARIWREIARYGMHDDDDCTIRDRFLDRLDTVAFRTPLSPSAVDVKAARNRLARSRTARQPFLCCCAIVEYLVLVVCAGCPADSWRKRWYSRGDGCAAMWLCLPAAMAASRTVQVEVLAAPKGHAGVPGCFQESCGTTMHGFVSPYQIAGLPCVVQRGHEMTGCCQVPGEHHAQICCAS